MEYRIEEHDRVVTGFGFTRNISSHGIAFEFVGDAKMGSLVALNVCWPVQLDGSVPLKLAVRGRLARCHGRVAAVRIEHSQFRILRIAAVRTMGGSR